MEDLVWRRKSFDIYKYIMLFFIRFSEILTSSIIPSLLGYMAVTVSPTPAVMRLMAVVAFFAFSGCCCVFWVRYIKHRPKTAEFYIMNGIVYAIYVGISIIGYKTGDTLFYTVVFCNLRGFEFFGAGTILSMIISHCTLVVAMIISQISAKYYYRYKSEQMKQNGADKIEIEVEAKTPQKGNEEVGFMSVEEVNIEWQREIEEAQEMVQDIYDSDDGSIWDKSMRKGDGSEIAEAVPFDFDNDVDDGDFTSEIYARNEMQSNMAYSEDALWSEDIYNGNSPIDLYEDDEDFFADNFSGEGDDEDEELWQGMRRGDGSALEFIPEEELAQRFEDDEDDEYFFDEPEMELPFESNEEDGLWDINMVKGRGEDIVADTEIDDEEFTDRPRWIDDGTDEDYSYDDDFDDEELFEVDHSRIDNVPEEFEEVGEDGFYVDRPGFTEEYDVDDDEDSPFYTNLPNNFEDYDEDSLWEEIRQGK